MKGVLLKQLQQVPGLVNRVFASSTNVAAGDCKPAAIFTDGGARGMVTGVDIMCGSSSSTAAKRQEKSKKANVDAGEPAVSVSSGSPAVAVAGEMEPQAYSSAAARQQQWWRPDPATGTWVPEGCEGRLTTTSHVTKSAPRVVRVRSDTAASLEDKRWWTSMEELPDMDRANPK